MGWAVDNWFDQLPECNYEYFKNYFKDNLWSRPSYYFTAASAIVVGMEYRPRGTTIKEYNGMPIVKYPGTTGDMYRIVCPRDYEDTVAACVDLLELTKFRIKVYSPDFIPSQGFKVYYRDQQAIYDCQHIIDNMPAIMGKRGMSYIRKYERECTYKEAGPEDSEAMSLLLDRWVKGPAGSKKKTTWHRSNRQIFEWLKEPDAKDKYDFTAYIAYRKGEPVAMSAIAPYRIKGYSGMAVQFMAKALNYRTSPQGGNNMSSWELWRCSQECIKKGIHFLNGGGYDMRESQYQALRKWKEQFTKGRIVENNQWFFAYTQKDNISNAEDIIGDGLLW